MKGGAGEDAGRGGEVFAVSSYLRFIHSNDYPSDFIIRDDFLLAYVSQVIVNLQFPC